MYIYMYMYIYSERDRERWREESGKVRCQCLEERESARGTCTNQQDSDPPHNPGSPDRTPPSAWGDAPDE